MSKKKNKQKQETSNGNQKESASSEVDNEGIEDGDEDLGLGEEGGEDDGLGFEPEGDEGGTDLDPDPEPVNEPEPKPQAAKPSRPSGSGKVAAKAAPRVGRTPDVEVLRGLNDQLRMVFESLGNESDLKLVKVRDHVQQAGVWFNDYLRTAK